MIEKRFWNERKNIYSAEFGPPLCRTGYCEAMLGCCAISRITPHPHLRQSQYPLSSHGNHMPKIKTASAACGGNEITVARVLITNISLQTCYAMPNSPQNKSQRKGLYCIESHIYIYIYVQWHNPNHITTDMPQVPKTSRVQTPIAKIILLSLQMEVPSNSSLSTSGNCHAYATSVFSFSRLTLLPEHRGSAPFNTSKHASASCDISAGEALSPY